MVHRPERRVLRFLAAAAVVLGLLLLLLPHPSAFHTDLAACFVLLPVLLFALVEIAEGPLPASADAFVCYSPDRAALFQRSPPSALV